MRRTITLFMILSILGFQALLSQSTILVAPGDNLITTVKDASAGDTIKLQAGRHVARYAGIKIEKSLNIVAETKVKPTVYIKQFDVMGENTDLYIEGIEFSGATVDSLTGDEDLETLRGDYFLNLDETMKSCGKITVKNCIIRNLNRCVVRGDRAAYSVTHFLFDGLIVSDLRGDGDYGPFRLKTNITFRTLTITNSTFHNMYVKFINTQDIPSMELDVLVKNCTFYRWGGKKSDQDLFDFKMNDLARLIIQDCILGKTNAEPDAEIPINVKGWRMDAANASYLEMITTVMTPDFILSDRGYDMVEWDKTEYNQVDVDPDWADPEAGDFTLPEGSLLLESSQIGGIVGDPRWDPNYGVGIKRLESTASFRFFPNPADRVFYLTMDPVLEGSSLTVYNTMGVTVKRFQNVHSDTPLLIADLQPGVYFVKIDSQASISAKLLVR